MRYRVILALAFLVLLAPFHAAAQTTFFPGGLTRLANEVWSANLLANGDFESGTTTGWNVPAGWSVDATTAHSGVRSFKWTGGAGDVSQPMSFDRGIYRLSGWVKTVGVGGAANTGLRLMFDLWPVAFPSVPDPPIAGTTDWTFYEVWLILDQPGNGRIVLNNYAGATLGEAWFDDLKVERLLSPPLDVFMLYPNYRGMLFDDKPQTMQFDVTVTPPNGDFGRFSTVRASLIEEATGLQAVPPRDYPACPAPPCSGSANFHADFDGSVMQSGRAYHVQLALLDSANGNVPFFIYPDFRVSKVPAAARASMNIAFDEKNHILMKGTPRFVLGVYDSALGYTTDQASWENTLFSATGDRRMGGLNINMYLNYWFGGADANSMNALMTVLQNHGVTYLQTGNCVTKFPADNGFQINATDAYVQNIGAHPGSAGYYTADECLPQLYRGVFDQYVRLRTLDPDSMTFGALLPEPSVFLWRDVVDVLSTDPYPLFGPEPAGGYPHNKVADGTILTREAVKNARPFFTVLQFFQFTSQGRWPTRAEMRNHAYMAIAEGAKGLFWWSLGDNALVDVCGNRSLWCPERIAHMDDLRAVVNELAALEPVLLADDAPTALTSNSNTAIRTKVKLSNGHGYVIAYNYTSATQTATFGWNTAPGTITVNAEGRTLTPSGNSFTDTFGPYQAHVYVIQNGGGGTPPPPPPLTVTFTSPTDGATVSGTQSVTLTAANGNGVGFGANYTFTFSDGTTTSTANGDQSATFSWDTTALGNGPVQLTGTVRDPFGATASARITVTINNPTSPPALIVSFVSPANGATVSGTITVALAAGGGTGTFSNYTVTVDNATPPIFSGTSSSFSWNTASVAPGAHTLTATVTDSAGRISTPASINVTVNNTTPLTVDITQPRNGDVVSGTNWVVVWPHGAQGTPTCTVKVNGTQVAQQACADSPTSIPWNTLAFTDGPYTLSVTITDTTTRSGTSSVSITINNGTPLTVDITQPRNGDTVSGTNWVVVWPHGAQGTPTCTIKVDGTQVAQQACSASPTSIPWNTTTFGEGTHTLSVTITDTTTRSSTSSVSIMVANTPLTIDITAPRNGDVVSGTNWVVVWPHNAQGTPNCTIRVDGTVVAQQACSASPTSIPWNTTAFPNGAHTLSVTLTDATSRTGSSSVSVTIGN